VAAVIGVVTWLYWAPPAKLLCGDEGTYMFAARDLLATGRAGLDLLWPPLYPHLLAGLLAVAGGSLLAVQATQLGLLLVAAAILHDLTGRLTGSRTAGAIAALLLLADPTMAAFATYLWPEVLHIFLFLVVLWILVSRSDHRGWLALAGLALGLALLTKSVLGPFTPVLVLPLLLRRPRRRGLASAALVAVVAAAVVAPVVVANGLGRGSWVVSDSSRFNLWLGLNDVSRRSLESDIAGEEYRRYLASAPDFRGRNDVLEGKIASLVGERGVPEVLRAQLGRQYFRLLDAETYLTEQLHGGFLHQTACGYGPVAASLAAPVRLYAYGFHAMLLVALALAVALPVDWRERGWLRVVLAFLAYNLLVFLLLHVKSRYRLQLVPFLDLLAGAGLAAAWARLRRADTPRVSGLRIAAAAALAALLLFLAFGSRLLSD
jgi:4-amino-4-deoxy-L-arabinose transferase-like glycosyltransferase